MTLLNELVTKYAQSDLEAVFQAVQLKNADKINSINLPELKEVTLAQWLLESGRAESNLATTANNFAGLKWREPDMIGFAEPLEIKVNSEIEAVNFCKFKDVDSFIKGYWKFLTRFPYAGLEEHTNTPETFIGFLQRKGYAADPNYVSKVINLIPESRSLLASTSGIAVSFSINKLQVTAYPQEVEVGQAFKVEGVAPLSNRNQKLSILVDNKFPGDDVQIGDNGKWQFNFVFHQAGDRQMKISTISETVAIAIKAVKSIDADDDDDAPNPQPLGSIVINLTKSVGVGVVNKNKDQVKAVKQRLRDLGYTWTGDPNSTTIDTGTVKAIELFQSIIAGRSTVAGDGRIDVGGTTHRWLQAKNAPRWITMPPSDSALGFVNYERNQTNDNHDFGTDWLANTILAIAQDFQVSFRNANPTAAPFAINDVSIPHGGDTPDHSGHETGLMCDVLLPKKGGSFGGVNWFDASFDRVATRALLKSIHKQKLVRAVFFNDTTLRGESLCTFALGHDNHIHFEINPPVRS